MYFECLGESSVSYTDSVLNRGTEPIIRFRLGFVLKFGLVLPVSIIGMGMVPVFVSHILSMDAGVNELGSIYYTYNPYFFLFL